MDFFEKRHTVRSYSDKYIDDALLDQMIEQAAHAPNTGNMQQYSVIITRSAEGKKALAPAHFNQPTVESCSALLTFCLDFNRFEAWCRASNAVPGYDNFQAFVWGVIDTSIFAQQFCTIAELEGLGCCYLGTTTYNADQIARVLDLPARVVPVTSIAVGYPSGESAVSDRLPIESIIHRERYHHRTDAEVKELYAAKEARDDSRQFVEENAKESLAQVFTDVRYTADACRYFSRLYADFIQSRGFKLPC